MKITRSQLKKLIKEELGKVMEALTIDDIFSQAASDVAGKFEFGGIPVSEDELRGALEAMLNRIPTPGAPDEGQRAKVRDSIINGLLKPGSEVRSRFLKNDWYEEIVDDAYRLGSNPSKWSEGLMPDWAEPWVDPFALRSKQRTTINIIKKEIN